MATRRCCFPPSPATTVPVIGNLLCSRENCEAAFGVDFREIRNFVDRAMGEPIPPRLVSKAPAQEIVLREGFDIRKIVPALFHAPGDGGHFITAGIVIVRDPETGVYNASYHRLQMHGPDRVGVKLDYGRHLRAAYERAKRRGEPLDRRCLHRRGPCPAFHGRDHGLADAGACR